MNVLVRPAKIGLWSEKGTPISAGSDLAPFTQVQITTEGRRFTTFPPQTSLKLFIEGTWETQVCNSNCLQKEPRTCVFFCCCCCSDLLKIQSRPLKWTLHAKIRVTTLTFLILEHSRRLNAPKIWSASTHPRLGNVYILLSTQTHGTNTTSLGVRIHSCWGSVKDIYNSEGQRRLRGDGGWTHFPNRVYKRYTSTRKKISLPNVNKCLRTTLQYSSMYNKI